jgi:enterochelin esterase family protein
MIRHTPRKALAKVYLQSGEYDIDNVHGSWPLANKEMFSALAFAGYDAKLEFGEGTHSVAHGGAVLPDALRWLWADDGENVNGASGSVKATVAVVTPGGGGTGGIARL